MIDSQDAMPPARGGKSLKEQNRWQLWLAVAFNCISLYIVAQTNAIEILGLRSALTNASNLLPVGLALFLTTVLNGLLNAENKARLVFLRWRHALPGHRAFELNAGSDPRIDRGALLKLQGSAFPTDPVDQNRAWYRIYKTVDKDPAVVQVHRDFLLLRDYTGISAIFLLVYGVIGLYAIRSPSARLGYLLFLLLQYVFVRQAASNYGIRMVTTVLALSAAKDNPKKPVRVPKTPSQEPPPKASKGRAKTKLPAIGP